MIVRTFALVVLASCGAGRDVPSAGSDCPPEPVQTAPAAKPTPATPPPRAPVRLLVRGDVVDGNGAIVATVPGAGRQYAAHPVGADQYALGPDVIDAVTAHVTPLPAIYDPGEGDYAIAGTFLVAAPLHGDLQLIDLATGKPRWHVAASPHSLVIAGDHLETTECSSTGDREWTVTYALSDGSVRAKTPAVSGCERRLVSEAEHVIDTFDYATSTVLDRHGHALFHVDRPVLKLAAAGPDLVVVTDQFVERTTPTGDVRWRVELHQTFGDSAELVTLPDGDILVTLYSGSADTGIGIWRIRPDGGRVIWRTWAPSLGVAHSKYRNESYTAIRGDKLFAVSQASGGDFFERIDLATGAREWRCHPIGSCAAPSPVVVDAGFVIGSNLVAPDGRVVHGLAGVSQYAMATPLGNHAFEVDGFEVDAATDSMTKAAPGVVLARDDRRPGEDRNAVVATADDGSIRWRQPLDGVRSVRPPDIAVGRDVLAAVMGTLRAYDRTTGAVRWSVAADAFSLRVVGDTAYYVTCNEPTHDHWLYGRSVADGSLTFRSALVDGCDPELIVDDRHEVAIERDTHAGSIVFDHAGHELYRLHEAIASIHPLGGDLVVVSDKQIARITDAGKVIWTLGTPGNTFVSANEFVGLAGGDLVIANYCAISDDGVDVIRVAPDGMVRWRTHVAGLGVAHSKYLQQVYLEERGDQLFVVSQASGGNFLARLDLATGAIGLRRVVQ